MSEGPTQSQLLVALADECELFRSEDFDTFATLPAPAGHFETWPIRSATFKRHLIREFWETNEKPPGSQALEDALKTLEARATFGGMTESVFRRVAECDDRIYVDLVNDAWEVVEISASGWKVLGNSPVKFVRVPGMLALPRPLTTGSVDDLKQVINYTNEVGPA